MHEAAMNKLLSVINELGLDANPAQWQASLTAFQKITKKNADIKEIIRIEFDTPHGITIVPFFDIHHGLKLCYYDKLSEYIEYVLKTPHCYTFLGGDTVENATKESVGLGLMEQEVHGDAQAMELADKLRPLAKAGKIIGGISGNHEMRSQKHSGHNPTRMLCNLLDIPFGLYSSYFELLVNGIPYHMMFYHGSGGGGTLGSKINAAARASQVALADVYVSGHSHARAFSEDMFSVPENGNLVPRRRVYVVGGSMINYFGGYAEQTMMRPGGSGYVLLSFSGEHKYVSVTF